MPCLLYLLALDTGEIQRSLEWLVEPFIALSFFTIVQDDTHVK